VLDHWTVASPILPYRTGTSVFHTPSLKINGERPRLAVVSARQTPRSNTGIPYAAGVSADIVRRAWDSNPRGRFRALAVFLAAVSHPRADPLFPGQDAALLVLAAMQTAQPLPG
jgi:hypothetical protein